MINEVKLKKMLKSFKIKRVERDLSQNDVSDAIGVSRNYYSQLESGAIRKPSEELLIKVAKFFKIDSDHLLITFGKLPSDIYDLVVSNPSLTKQLRNKLNKKD